MSIRLMSGNAILDKIMRKSAALSVQPLVETLLGDPVSDPVHLDISELLPLQQFIHGPPAALKNKR